MVVCYRYVVNMQVACLSTSGMSFKRNMGIFIQGVPGGMDKTSGECSLC